MHGVDGLWGRLWKTNVPPKVRSFLWRAARNNLPSKERLLSRGVAVGGECETCKSSFENLWHTFFFCSFAEDCWRCSDLGQYISNITNSCDSFVEALFCIIGGNNEELTARVCMVLWQIWKDRNRAIWEGVFPVPARSVLQAAEARIEWLLAREKRSVQHPSSSPAVTCGGWHPLPLEYVKCNVDATFFSDINAVGIGIVVRSHDGNFVTGKSMKLMGLRRVDEGELIGIKEALSWLKFLGLSRGWVESDCKRACEALCSSERNISEMGTLAAFCRKELASMPDIQVNHVRREHNGIAHFLAKAARDFDTHHVWNEPPLAVEGHFHLPCSCV
ncbi:uncharacterized protein LOC130990645 [Salvia miltiorrhiza]|uniref:uncharacterized protein LOC130990645 n=1 Tax=Salvia miltiorrhiza TaxID=226208 RepID=UPI0025ACD938|nr:uncharacterized protein LOC130990645 [Salvia miltiorrhiza]